MGGGGVMGGAGLFQPKVKGTVWARQGSERFYSSAAVFESSAFQQRGWRKRSAPRISAHCVVVGSLHLSASLLTFSGQMLILLYIYGGDGRDFCEMVSGLVGLGLRTPKNSSDVFIVFFCFYFFCCRGHSARPPAPPFP